VPLRDDSRTGIWRWHGDGVALRVDPHTFAGFFEQSDSSNRWDFDLPVPSAPGTAPEVLPDSVQRLERGLRGTVLIDGSPVAVEIGLSGAGGSIDFNLSPMDDKPRSRALRLAPVLRPHGRRSSELALPLKTTQGIVSRPTPDEQLDFTIDAAGNNSEGLSMPFWSLSAAGGGVLAILETPDDVQLTVRCDLSTGVWVEVGWLPSLGRLRYRRTLHYVLVPEGYQAAALAYREHVIRSGRFKSLAQKIDERPEVAGLVGAPYFSTGYLPYSARKLKQVLRGLRTIGYTAGLLGPIDYLQWQAEPWLNDYQPFISAPEYAQIIAAEGFTPFAWFYLEDILEFDPSYDRTMLAVDEHDQVPTGWENRDYRYARVCDAVLAKHGRKLRDRAGQYTGLHFDTTTCKALMECWSPEHPMNRTEDRLARRSWLDEVAGWGHLIGSEGGCDWAFDVMDYCSNNPRRDLQTNFPGSAQHVPLQGLVYHDSIVSYGWEYDPYNRSYWGGDWSREKLLYDVMCGNPPTVSPVFGYFPVISGGVQAVSSSWVTWEQEDTQRLLRAALPVAMLHGETALSAMIEHSWLDEEGDVSRTVYSNGTSVLVNAGGLAFDDHDVHLEASSYRINTPS